MEMYAESGSVRFEYKHLAFLGPESVEAAQAAECANDQGQFWQYHDTLFANQRGENLGAYSDSALKSFAAAIGLDEQTFNNCLNSNRYRLDVQRETTAGNDLGVRSTPTLIVNGELIEGVVRFDQLQPIIQREIASSG